jgi:hypothetical protein
MGYDEKENNKHANWFCHPIDDDGHAAGTIKKSDVKV